MAPAKYGSAYQHQKPDHRAKLGYIHSDRSHLNESWHREYQANGHPKTLRNYLSDTKKVVKEKTKRSMQKKAEEKVIAEAVVVIDEETTMEDLQKLGKAMEDQYGWTTIQIHIHRDEGYLGERSSDQKHREGKYNLHAHMFFVTTNLQTGKSWKWSPKDGSEMQDITAQSLNLTRGIRKEERKEAVKETLNVMEYKEVVAEAKKAEVEKEITELQEEQNKILENTRAIQKQRNELENESRMMKSQIDHLTSINSEIKASIDNLDKEYSDRQKRAKNALKNAITGIGIKISDITEMLQNKRQRELQAHESNLLDQQNRIIAETLEQKEKIISEAVAEAKRKGQAMINEVVPTLRGVIQNERAEVINYKDDVMREVNSIITTVSRESLQLIDKDRTLLNLLYGLDNVYMDRAFQVAMYRETLCLSREDEENLIGGKVVKNNPNHQIWIGSQLVKCPFEYSLEADLNTSGVMQLWAKIEDAWMNIEAFVEQVISSLKTAVQNITQRQAPSIKTHEQMLEELTDDLDLTYEPDEDEIRQKARKKSRGFRL